MSRIGGKNFDVNLGDLLVHVENCTLDITDNTAVAQSKGVPDGHVDGDVSASGEMEFTTSNFNLLIEAARSAGSFRELEPFDVVFFAKAGDEELRVEAFACSRHIAVDVTVRHALGLRHGGVVGDVQGAGLDMNEQIAQVHVEVLAANT